MNSLYHLDTGGDEENRTPDPLLARQVLSQLSYTPKFNLILRQDRLGILVYSLRCLSSSKIKLLYLRVISLLDFISFGLLVNFIQIVLIHDRRVLLYSRE